MLERADFLKSAKLVVRNATKKWLKGEPASVEEVLSTHPQMAQDDTCVLALIWAEYLVRRGRGEEAKPAEFSGRFPEQKPRIERLFEQKLKERDAAIATLGPEKIQRQEETQAIDDPFATVRLAMTPSAHAALSIKAPPVPVKDGESQTIGRFQLKALLGKGAFGKVYRALDPQLDREVALKVPRVGTVDTEDEASRFLREARAAGQLRHPNIVPVFDAGRIDDTYYIASGFIQGETLQQVLETKVKFAPQDAARIVAKMAGAIHYAHTKGIVHRDLKPANTMLDADEEPLIMDFGLARRSEGETLRTTEGAFMGTPAYMSPEQASGNAHLADGRSDQWTLGVMLYEMLTGKRPFHGDRMGILLAIQSGEPKPLRQHDPTIPRDLENICLRCLEKHPGKRYRECQDLAEDLESWLRGDPVAARPISTLERLGRWGKRSPTIASLVGVITALATAFLIFVGLNNIRLEKQRNDLTKAVALADEKSKLATEKEKLASEKGKLARENELLAERFGNEQKAALEKLKSEVAARQKAEGLAQDATSAKTIAEFETSKAKSKAAKEVTQRKQREVEIATLEAVGSKLVDIQSQGVYFNTISTCDRLIKNNRNSSARELLDTCNPKLKNWEWYYLDHRLTSPAEADYYVPLPGSFAEYTHVVAVANGRFVLLGKKGLLLFDIKRNTLTSPVRFKKGFTLNDYNDGPDCFLASLNCIVGRRELSRGRKRLFWIDIDSALIGESTDFRKVGIISGEGRCLATTTESLATTTESVVVLEVVRNAHITTSFLDITHTVVGVGRFSEATCYAISSSGKTAAMYSERYDSQEKKRAHFMDVYGPDGEESSFRLGDAPTFAAFGRSPDPAKLDPMVQVTADDQLAVVVNNQLLVYDVSTGKVANSIEPHLRWISAIHANRLMCNGTRLIGVPRGGSRYAQSKLYDSRTGQELLDLSDGDNVYGGSIRSDDSSAIVSLKYDGIHVRTIDEEGALALNLAGGKGQKSGE